MIASEREVKWMDYFEYLNLTPIELLGYAKNNIIESRWKIENLPCDYEMKLNKAYTLLDEVQEYLFSH